MPKLIISAELVSLKLLQTAFGDDKLGLATSEACTGNATWSEYADFDRFVSATGAFAVGLTVFDGLDFLVHFLESFRDWERLLYIRPRLLRFPDGIWAFTELSSKHHNVLRKVFACDNLLCRGIVLETENLYHDRKGSLRAIAQWLHAGTPALRDDQMSGGSFDAAMSSFRYSIRTHSQTRKNLARTNVVYQIGKGRSGTDFLQEGWHSPEENFAWSNGSVATLRLCTDLSHGQLRCRLKGRLVQPQILVRVRVGTRAVRAIRFSDSDISFSCIDFSLGAVENTNVEIELCFTSTLRPADVDEHSSDFRMLGLALQSLEIYPAHSTGALKNDWAEIAENDPNHSCLLYISDSDRARECASVFKLDNRILATLSSRRNGASDDQFEVVVSQASVAEFIDFLTLLDQSVRVVVGLHRVDAFLQASIDLKGLSDWLEVTFLLAPGQISAFLLNWVHKHGYTLIVEPGRVLVFPQRI